MIALECAVKSVNVKDGFVVIEAGTGAVITTTFAAGTTFGAMTV